MNQTLDPALEPVLRAFASPAGGVVGVVDDLLAGCPDDGLRLVWADGTCFVGRLVGPPEDAVPVALPRPAFRALLARMAALCNEVSAGSVTPFGGTGTLGNAQTLYRAAFANTPSDQWLDLTRFPSDAADTGR